MEQSGTRVEQVSGCKGWWIGQFFRSEIAISGLQRGSKWPQSAIIVVDFPIGSTGIWRPQMGRTKGNKGGASEGTYGPVTN